MKIEPLTRFGCEREKKCVQYKARVHYLEGNWHPEILFYAENGQLLSWHFCEEADRQIFSTIGVATQLFIYQKLMDQNNLKDVVE